MTKRQAPASSGLASVEEALHREGLPLTIQRRAIFEALEGRRDHPTADQVYESVRARIPGLSRTTVYRVLETLVRVGAARKVGHPGAASRFDPRVDHHHHLICVECGRVVDLELAGEKKITVPQARNGGFRVFDYSIHFTGICGECGGTKRPDPAGRKKR